MAGSKKGHTPQANVPLTPSDEDVLRALMFLEGRPASEILRPSVEAFLHDKAKTAEVRDALAVLRRHRTKTGENKLTSIRDRLKSQDGA
jgi:hypothetical protein